MTDSPTPTPTDTGKKLTKARRDHLERLERHGHAVEFGHVTLVMEWLAERSLISLYEARIGVWKQAITPAGRQALAALPKDNHHD